MGADKPTAENYRLLELIFHNTQDREPTALKIAFVALLALVSSFTLFSVVTLEGESTRQALAAIFPMHVGAGAVTLLLFICYSGIFIHAKKPTAASVVLSASLALCLVLGRSLNAYGDLSFVTSRSLYLMLSLLFFIGYTGIFYAVTTTILAAIDHVSSIPSICREENAREAKIGGVPIVLSRGIRPFDGRFLAMLTQAPPSLRFPPAVRLRTEPCPS